jgi:redox-sensing transcriptional repressor
MPHHEMESNNHEAIPEPVVRRLSLYLRQLETFKLNGKLTISSKSLGQSLNLTDAQVRKDLTWFGQFGRAGIGYKVDDLISRVRRILGTDKSRNVLLVGAGNLGRALCAYKGFEEKGFRIAAVFDRDVSSIPKTREDESTKKTDGPQCVPVLPMSQLKETVLRLDIHLAILAVPADQAQDVVDDLVDAGISGILNFAPVSLRVPKRVSINSVDMAVELEQLLFQVNFAIPPRQS